MSSQFALKLGRHSVSVALTSSFSPSTTSEMRPSLAELKDKAQKTGFLKKLSGRGILSNGSWRERYCVLVNNRIYFFTSEQTPGKPSGYLSLEDYDSVNQAPARGTKKVANVFAISASERGIFDTHSAVYFAADTTAEMEKWMEGITDVLGRPRSEPAKKVTKEESSPKKTEKTEPAVKSDEPGGCKAGGGSEARRSNKAHYHGSASSSLKSTEKCEIDETHYEQVPRKVKPKSSEGKGEAGDGSSLKLSLQRPNTCDPVTICRMTKRAVTASPGAWSETRKTLMNRLENERPFSKTSSMTYCYSSSSDESLNEKSTKRAQSKHHLDIKKTVTVSRAGKNYCVTPPPPVIRRIRTEMCESSNHTPRTSRDLDSQDFIPFIPELAMSSARRASSGSSLSTIKADKLNQPLDNNTFSSLQRRSNNGNKKITNGSTKSYGSHTMFKGSASATASPLLSTYHPRSSSRCRSIQPVYTTTEDTAGSSNRNGDARAAMEFTETFEALKEDMGQFAFQLRQLDVDISSMRQDIGSVQENIATVRGTLDFTRERVTRLINEVMNVERQIGAVVKETTVAREEAGKMLEAAEIAKATHEQLREEANHLLDFLRQATGGHPGGLDESKKRFSFRMTDDHTSNLNPNQTQRHERAETRAGGLMESNNKNGDSGNELFDNDDEDDDDDDDQSEITLLPES